MRHGRSRTLSFDHLLGRDILRYEILGRTRHAVFVGSAIDGRIMARKIVVRHRRAHLPFKCRRAPWISLRGLAVLNAPKKVEIEEQLRRGRYECRDADKYVYGLEARQIMNRVSTGVTPGIARVPEVVHWHENAVDANKGHPEVNLPERFVHHVAKHFREPI